MRINRQVRNWVPESFIVDVDRENEMYACNCKGFIFEGFLCQHAIKVLHHVGEERLPERYILKRWCKGANANVKRSVEERCRGEGEIEAIRAFKRTKLYLLYKKIEDIAANDASGEFEEALSRMQALEGDLASRKKQTIPLHVSAPLIEEGGKSESPAMYLDPPLSQCKGRKKVPVRWKPTGEKITKKGRTCSYCHAKEQHNIRTCPKRIRDATKGKKQIEIDEDESGFEDEDAMSSEEESAI